MELRVMLRRRGHIEAYPFIEKENRLVVHFL
jgi:hypothetical protein